MLLLIVFEAVLGSFGRWISLKVFYEKFCNIELLKIIEPKDWKSSAQMRKNYKFWEFSKIDISALNWYEIIVNLSNHFEYFTLDCESMWAEFYAKNSKEK